MGSYDNRTRRLAQAISNAVADPITALSFRHKLSRASEERERRERPSRSGWVPPGRSARCANARGGGLYDVGAVSGPSTSVLEVLLVTAASRVRSA